MTAQAQIRRQVSPGDVAAFHRDTQYLVDGMVRLRTLATSVATVAADGTWISQQLPDDLQAQYEELEDRLIDEGVRRGLLPADIPRNRDKRVGMP